jgi:cyanate permease
MKKSTKNKNEEKSNWAIGGTTMIGLGVGLIYLQTSVLIFVAALIIGIGAGLIISPVLSLFEKNKAENI